MDAIHRLQRPVLRRPYAIIAFEGWNDACDAASGAVEYLLGQYNVEDPIAVVEPDEFFDFQAHRPKLSLDEEGVRSLTWPSSRLYAIELPDEERDLIVVTGEEPSHRWKTFSRSILSELADMGVELSRAARCLHRADSTHQGSYRWLGWQPTRRWSTASI